MLFSTGADQFRRCDCGPLPAGSYTVQVVGFTVVNATYTGTATVAPEPSLATGTARYKKAQHDFQRSQELSSGPTYRKLQRQRNQGQIRMWNRASSTTFGNFYVAVLKACRTVSMMEVIAMRASFSYHWAADGIKIGSALAGVDGVGLGER